MEKKGLGLYVHIPFCTRKCLYCDFLSGTASEAEKAEYIKLLCQEITAWGRLLPDCCLNTIFIGGGTPSCLSSGQVRQLAQSIQSAFEINETAEITIEANPGTVRQEMISAWQELKVNRVSLGLQSAQDNELNALGRIHTYRQFLDTYELLRASGIENINVDIMAAIPLQTMDSYRNTVEQVVSLQPEHISAYSLIIEPGTEFHRMKQEGNLCLASEETDRQMYEYTGNYLEQNGYFRYEISNYARKGKECRHNCGYWQLKDYLGVGLGASSFLEGCRFIHPSEKEEYAAYVEKIQDRTLLSWKEIQGLDMEKPSVNRQMEEFMFLGLRMRKGISRKEFELLFSRSYESVYGTATRNLFQKKLLAVDDFRDRIYLTNQGIDLSNMVLSDFLLDE